MSTYITRILCGLTIGALSGYLFEDFWLALVVSAAIIGLIESVGYLLGGDLP